MIRVVFIIRSFARGGAERQLLELLKHLDKARFAIRVICLYPGGELWDEATSISGVDVEDMGKTARWNFSAVLRLVGRLRDLKPHVVHGYMDVANLLALVAKPYGSKVIWGIRATRLDISKYDTVRRFIYWLESPLARFCDQVICNSEAAYAELRRRGFPRSRACVIPNGIDTSKFSWNPDARRRIRAEWGIAPDQFLVGMVGRLDPMKGHEVFLNAAGLVRQWGDGFRFVLIGDGQPDFKEKLQRLARQLGLENDLVWVEARSDIAAVFCALDLSVSASVFGEGFSNVIAESLACTIPCVATDVGDAAKILGGHEWVVRPNDAMDLAGKVADARRRRHANDEEARRCANYVECNFGPARLARSTERVLLDLLDDGRNADRV